MSEQGQERKERYRRVRTEFDDLDAEDKVLFLMEATVSTIARGVDEFGRAVSDELNKAFSRRAEKKEKADRESDASASGGSASSKSSSGRDSATKGSSASSSKSTGAPPASDNGSEEDGETNP